MDIFVLIYILKNALIVKCMCTVYGYYKYARKYLFVKVKPIPRDDTCRAKRMIVLIGKAQVRSTRPLLNVIGDAIIRLFFEATV